MSVFVDTSGLLAVANERDPHHGPAAATWVELADSGRELVTSSYVLLEAHAVFERQVGIATVRVLEHDLVKALSVLWVSRGTHNLGVGRLLSDDRRKLSLVDCVSFLVMRNLGITQVFTFDKHFAEEGFEVLPPTATGDPGSAASGTRTSR
jgi:uncharacterized protein